jgi:hypothetical protein
MTPNEEPEGLEALELPKGYGLYLCPDGWIWIKWADPLRRETRRDGPFESKGIARQEAWLDAKEAE